MSDRSKKIDELVELETSVNDDILPIVDTSENETKYQTKENLLKEVNLSITEHIADTDNPHAVTKAQVGLGNVDDTSDVNKPISTATQGALDDKADASDLSSHTGNTNNPHSVTKTQVGLENADNTSDANKPISTAVQTALDDKADLVDGLVPANQLPSYVDDVIEVANFGALPVTGEAGKIYVTLDDNKTYRWGGSAYAEISASLALGETSATAYRGDRGKTAYDHSQTSGNPHSTSKTDVGLGNADNTSDVNKPVSTAQQTALNLKADASALSSHTGNTSNPHAVTKDQVGLSEVDNTSDADKPISSDTQSALDNKEDSLGFTPENSANKGKALGYAELDGGGKVPLSSLPSSLLVYKGVWNATTNEPVLTATDVTKKGYVYVVSVAGTQFGIDFNLGDWLIYNDSGVAEKSDNSDDVVTVNGKTGTVVINPDDLDDTLTAHKFVTDTQKSNWDTAYGWGNHAGLYDTIGTASSLVGSHESTYNHSNYNTAYGWGNHASVGYLTSKTGALLATGAVTGATAQAQAFTNGVISPYFTGGTAVGDKIVYKSTTGAGTATGVAHQFIGGTNGGTIAMSILNNGNVGIGINNPTKALDVAGSLSIGNTGGTTYSLVGPTPITGTWSDNIEGLMAVKQRGEASGNIRALSGVAEFTGTVDSSSIIMGINGFAYSTAASTGNLTASNVQGGSLRNRYGVQHAGTGTVTFASGISSFVNTGSGAGDITDSAAFHAENPTTQASSTRTTFSGLWVRGGTISGTLTNRYGVRVDTLNGGTNKWGVWVESDDSYFGGNVGIATVSPTAKLDINSDIIRLRTPKTPSTAGATGNQGDICWDTGFIYACVDTNTWKRASLATW